MALKIKRMLVIVSIFAVAMTLAYGLTKMKQAPETKETDDIPVLVETMPLEATTARFTIDSQGTVRPRTETVLSAEVAGSIVSISPKFTAGGVFAKGEELLRIDPTNYVVAVEQAEALVRQRQVEYDGAVKLKDKGYRAETELAAAAAALAGARAELVRASRNLERTSIRLPYDGLVRAKEADLGQYVAPGSRLGVTFATGYAEIRLPLSDNDLAFVELPDPADVAASGEAEGPEVRLVAEQRGRKVAWEAQIVRTEGVVDDRNRVTYAVARVKDPYCLDKACEAQAPLPMGTFVRAHIAGTTLENVIRVPRLSLRNGNQLMFVDENSRLRIRTIDVLRADADYAYIRDGASIGERISLTAIEAPVNGMKVRTGEDLVDESGDGQLAAGGEQSP